MNEQLALCASMDSKGLERSEPWGDIRWSI